MATASVALEEMMQENSKSDWIEWRGGECPVAPDTIVYVQMRDEDERDALAASCRADSMAWDHVRSEVKGTGDIIAYRVVAE